MSTERALLHHFLAVLAYRADKALRDAPADFPDFQAGGGVRTPTELLHHMTSVLMRTADRLSETESAALEPVPFELAVDRFHVSMRALAAALAGVPLREDRLAERLLQGPLSDTMTHVGQLALLRRLAGSPIEPEDYFRANIGSGDPDPRRTLPDDDQVPGGDRTITGVATSVAAFLGRTAAGPIGRAHRCRSYADFLRTFQGPHPSSDLAESVRQFFENGGSDCHVVRLAEGADAGDAGSPPTPADYRGSAAEGTGFHALDAVDRFNLMVLPRDRDISEADFLQVLGPASICCERNRAMLLLDAPRSWTREGRPVADRNAADALRALVVSENSAVFYPDLVYGDGGRKQTIGPTGAIAGLMARTDAARGVWKAPAGMDATIQGVLGLEVELTDAQNAVLNPLAVNCLRVRPTGFVNWGARTLAGADGTRSEWTYLPVRRLALFLEASLDRGTRWVRSEPNEEPLWGRVRLVVGAFMHGLFRQGAFRGSTPDQAFFVKCDGETTTQDDRERGIVNIVVGFAPVRPAEFVILRVRQRGGET